MELIAALTIRVDDLRMKLQSLPLEELYRLYLDFINPENERPDDGYVDHEIKVIQTWLRRSAIEPVLFVINE